MLNLLLRNQFQVLLAPIQQNLNFHYEIHHIYVFFTDRELEIPVVNNEEVIHLVCKVLIKSQMLHFSSNLFYIKLFGEQILKCDQNMRSILNNFEVAMNHIMTLDESTMKSGELEDGITACEMMKLLSEEERSVVRYSCNLEFEKRKRLVSLVMTSTAEKNLVLSDQSKVFI
nr:uncharacterized protein LOC111515220 [Leptinotarsa decemlineata]